MRAVAKALVVGVGALAFCTGIGAAPAQADFGLKTFAAGFVNEDGSEATQAGSHPFAMTTSLDVETRIDPELGEIPDGAVKTLRFQLPAGLIGSRTAVPRCSTVDFLTIDGDLRPACGDATAIGWTRLQLLRPGEGGAAAIYNLVPPPGVAAEIGFIAAGVPVTAEIAINGEPPNNLVAGLFNIPQIVNFFGADLELWGIPGSHSHDPFRGRCLKVEPGPDGEPLSEGTCAPASADAPLLTLPRSCSGPLRTSYEAISWSRAAKPDHGSSESAGMTACSALGFSPRITSKPTSASAQSASGLDFNIDVNDEGLTSSAETAIAQSDIEGLVVAMPAGMTVNPSAANGLATCSKTAYEAESLATEPGEACPQASKIGDVEVRSPLLAEGETLDGSVFLASQDDNPFGSLLALYVVLKDRELGVLIKRAGKVEASEEHGPNAGRIVTIFQGLPQIPFSHLNFRFSEGARAPLVTPPACGRYATEAEFRPWADPENPLHTTATFEIGSGVGGGPCPRGGVPPFHPLFEAGSVNNAAGRYSPFDMRLSRADGEQEMTRLDAALPKGVLGKLAGVGRCPDSAIAAARNKSGRAELADPSCPAGSQIGRVVGGAGVGSTLTYVSGRLYLGGPFAGDPLSAIAIVPAVAGPFDVGTVVVREALTVDPETAEVKVEGGHSDPIPHILRGIPLDVRDLRVYADRPNFTLNPTSCAVKRAKATLFGSFLDVFNPADDVPVSLSDRYQAASCAGLRFKPRLSLKLSGGSRRGDHPALRATLTTPRGSGYANIAKVVTTLPHSMFLDQGHIRTICTRVQFGAGKCPPGSVYGQARAFTPLLDQPLKGPVYLRSSTHPLPDLVVALHGAVDFNLVGRLDSVKARIRTRFESVPDAPVSKFVLRLPAGRKSLIVNSRDLCAQVSRATTSYTAQNGKGLTQTPRVAANCKQLRKGKPKGAR
jgi:hypothetical protein